MHQSLPTRPRAIVTLASLAFAILACLGPRAAHARSPRAKDVHKAAAAGRVKQATKTHGPALKALLKRHGISTLKRLALRVRKLDGALEVWGSGAPSGPLTLLDTIAICATSGGLGPKRVQGDGQVPEGVYHVDRLNAWSAYHLSLGVNYPNASDRARRPRTGGTRPLGGDIFIHGDCVTIGCVPIRDAQIERVFLLVLWAFEGGARTVPVLMLPTALDAPGTARLQRMVPRSDPRWVLWDELARVDRAFLASHVWPRVRITEAGAYTVR